MSQQSNIAADLLAELPLRGYRINLRRWRWRG
jgi:hypothetical protein